MTIKYRIPWWQRRPGRPGANGELLTYEPHPNDGHVGADVEHLQARIKALHEKAKAAGFVPQEVEPVTLLEVAPSPIEVKWYERVPALFHDAHVEHFPAAVTDKLRAWSAAGEQTLEWPNLVLAGPTGVGKTHAAVAAARPLHMSGTYEIDVVTQADALDAMRPNDDDAPHRWALERWRDDPVVLLVLDDMGVMELSAWARERLTLILDARVRRRQPTIITTNLSAAELKEYAGERIYSRIMGNAVAVKLDGKDRRSLPAAPAAPAPADVPPDQLCCKDGWRGEATVYPCEVHRPALYQRWRDGHFHPDHNRASCEGCATTVQDRRQLRARRAAVRKVGGE